MYAAFVDLKSAFELGSRNKLWMVLQELGMPTDLLSFIVHLHENNFAQIRWGSQGNVTCSFPVEKGVRQGCVMAPTLLSLFIKRVTKFLATVPTDAPVLAGIKIPILMSSDDTR